MAIEHSQAARPKTPQKSRLGQISISR